LDPRLSFLPHVLKDVLFVFDLPAEFDVIRTRSEHSQTTKVSLAWQSGQESSYLVFDDNRVCVAVIEQFEQFD
jgi:hypothetical protein